MTSDRRCEKTTEGNPGNPLKRRFTASDDFETLGQTRVKAKGLGELYDRSETERHTKEPGRRRDSCLQEDILESIRAGENSARLGFGSYSDLIRFPSFAMLTRGIWCRRTSDESLEVGTSSSWASSQQVNFFFFGIARRVLRAGELLVGTSATLS